MSKITSNLTNKTFKSSPYREFEVPDDSDNEYLSSDIDFATIDAQRIKRGLPPLDEDIKLQMIQSQKQTNTKQTFSSTIPEEEMTIDKLEEIERKIQSAKKNNGVEKLSLAAKNRIEALCGMSKSTKEIDLDGNKYELHGLKGKDQRAAIVAAANFDGTAHAAFEIRKQFLARALVAINGTDLELYLGSNLLEAKLEFIEELEEPMLIKLYSEYLNMVQETQDRYFIKSENDAKEVVEDLKK